MARKFNELFSKMAPDAQARVNEWVQNEVKNLALGELREARNLTQVELAKRLKIDQAAVSKIEHRTDMYLSTLVTMIEGMGGKLKMVAEFPSGEVQFATIRIPKEEPVERHSAGMALAATEEVPTAATNRKAATAQAFRQHTTSKRRVSRRASRG